MVRGNRGMGKLHSEELSELKWLEVTGECKNCIVRSLATTNG
jgi:hypothetical protein